jgi:hypothetical protein
LCVCTSDMVDTTPEEQRVRVEPAETSPNYRKIVVDGIIGHIDSIGLKAVVYSESAVNNEVLSADPRAYDKKKGKRTIECELIINPQMLNNMYWFLGDQLEQYEAIYGKLPPSGEVQSRRKKYIESKRSSNRQNTTA